MPALASAPERTSQIIRANMHHLVLLKEPKFSEAIARCRMLAVANTLKSSLEELDPQGRYEVVNRGGKQFDWGLIDTKLPPSMIIAELIGRTEAAILLQALIVIDPGNQVRYAIARLADIEIVE